MNNIDSTAARRAAWGLLISGTTVGGWLAGHFFSAAPPALILPLVFGCVGIVISVALLLASVLIP